MRFRFFIALFITALISFSQQIEAIEKMGDEYFKNAQYLQAIKYYKTILGERPTYLRAQYKLGETYRLIQDYESAEFYYESLALAKDPRFPLAGFYYALMQKLKGNYELAIRTFRTFRNDLVKDGLHEEEDLRYFYKQAKIEIDGCQLALNQITIVHPEYGFEVLPEPLNSEFNDYAAFSFVHDSLLCLTSARKGGTGKLQDNQFGEAFADLFRFEKGSKGWESYKSSDRFENVINTKWGDGSGSFNRERTKFYYTNCDSDLGEICQIFVSDLKDGRWSSPIPLNRNINNRENSSKHPNLSPQGDTLFYVSDKPGGVGGLDIWMSINAGNDRWGPSVNLGDQINTPFNEVSPFYDQHERVLFFASDGHRGFGGYDIYIARGSSFAAAEIHNAGLPFNSNLDDIFFFLGNQRGYLSSNRDEGIGKFDIYGFGIKSKENIIMEVSTQATVAGRNSLFTDDYNFDSEEAEIINQIISRKLSAEFSGTNLYLTSDQLLVYESLGQDDLDRIEKIVNARLRKMTKSMIRSVRSEDDFYYQQLESDRRKEVDGVVATHIAQRGLGGGIVLAEKEAAFYDGMDPGEREKLEILISERIRNAEDYTPYPATYMTYEENDRNKIDGMTSRYFEQKKGWQTASLAVDQRDFWRSHAATESHKVSTAIREKILVMSALPENQLTNEDITFYHELSEENQGKLVRIAEAILQSDFDTFEEIAAPEDLEIYQEFNTTSDKILDKILLKIISNMVDTDIYIVETTFENWQLLTNTKSNPEEIIAEFKKLKPELTQREVDALERFVLTSYNTYLLNNKTIFLNMLPVVSLTQTKGENDVYELEQELLEEYYQLVGNKRRVMDKLIGLRYINKAYADRDLETSDNGLFRSFLPYEKRHIEILAKNVSGAELAPQEKDYLTEAFTFYNAQSKNRKALLNRLVLARSFDRVNGKFVLNRPDAAVNGSFSTDQITLIEGLEKFRSSNERILTENLAVEAKDVDQLPQGMMALVSPVDSFDPSGEILARQSELETSQGRIILSLPKTELSKYDQLVISGQLVDKKTGKALSMHPVSLVNDKDQEEVVIYEYTDENGYFIFNASSSDYQFVTEDVTGIGEFTIRNLKIEGLDQIGGNVSASKVYFDVDSDNLRSEARNLVKDILDAIGNNSVRIEVESHTDNTGGEHYNKILSRRRGQTVMDYFVRNGIKQSNVSVIWHGQEKPIAANNNPYGRQLNRRVEIRVISNELPQTDFGTIYLAKPGSTMNEVAVALGISLKDLQEINGTQNTNLRAYQPIRVTTEVNDPDINVVASTENSNLSDFEYTVKVGDSIESISLKFRVPEELILEANSIGPNGVIPGKKLKIFTGFSFNQ